MLFVFVLLALLEPAALSADPAGKFPSWEEAAAFLAGAAELEELDGETLERFDELRRRPLRLNSAGRAAMLSSGLLSPYQVASILDLRNRTGAILSLTELSLADGIGAETAAALSYFVRLDPTSSPPGGSGARLPPLQVEAAVRGGIRADSDRPSQVGPDLKDAARLTLRSGDLLSASVGTSAPYERSRSVTGSVALSSRDGRAVFLAGDLNARFGQGLALWSGMTMSGVTSPEATVRKGSGVSASASFSGAGRLRGFAADFDGGRSRLTLLAASPCFAANANRYWKRGQAGATLLLNSSSASSKGGSAGASTVVVASTDWRASFSGIDFWGEAAAEFRQDPASLSGVSGNSSTPAADSAVPAIFSVVPAAVAGVSWNPRYGTTVAAVGRVYPSDYVGALAGALRAATKTSDESGLCLAARSGPFSLSSDFAFHPSNGRRQIKTLLLVNPAIPLGSATLTPSVRYALRYRPYENIRFRHDLRLDADLIAGEWQFHGRYNTLWYRDRSWAWYGEAVWRDSGRRFWASLRAGLFKVDNWDDRIYVYERDLPGCFTVPSLYGRGWNASATAGLRLRRPQSPPDSGALPAKHGAVPSSASGALPAKPGAVPSSASGALPAKPGAVPSSASGALPAKPGAVPSRRAVRRLDFRAGITSYPWTRPEKATRVELRAQYSVSW